MDNENVLKRLLGVGEEGETIPLFSDEVVEKMGTPQKLLSYAINYFTGDLRVVKSFTTHCLSKPFAMALALSIFLTEYKIFFNESLRKGDPERDATLLLKMQEILDGLLQSPDVSKESGVGSRPEAERYWGMVRAMFRIYFHEIAEEVSGVEKGE